MLTALKEHGTSSKHWSLALFLIGCSGSCYHSTDVLDKFCVNAVHPPPVVLSLKALNTFPLHYVPREERFLSGGRLLKPSPTGEYQYCRS